MSRKRKLLILLVVVAAVLVLGALYVMSWDGWTFSFRRCRPDNESPFC